MIINVFSPMKQEKIKEVLEANEKPKYVLVGELYTPMMKYEVTNAEDVTDVANYTKQLIQAQPWGRVLFIRVTVDA